jgi:hypothetical protein
MYSTILKDVWLWLESNQQLFFNIFLAYAFIELLFYFYVRYVLFPRRQILTAPPAPVMPPLQLIMRVLDHLAILESYSSHEYFKGQSGMCDMKLIYKYLHV